MSYRCVYCGAVSHHPLDAEEKYCGRCHRWAADDNPLGRYMRHYVHDESHLPHRASMRERGKFCEDIDKRRVAQTFTEHFESSTVFLGLDHGFGHKGPPRLFESMVFDRRKPLVESVIDGKMHEEWHDYECV